MNLNDLSMDELIECFNKIEAYLKFLEKKKQESR